MIAFVENGRNGPPFVFSQQKQENSREKRQQKRPRAYPLKKGCVRDANVSGGYQKWDALCPKRRPGVIGRH